MDKWREKYEPEPESSSEDVIPDFSDRNYYAGYHIFVYSYRYGHR